METSSNGWPASKDPKEIGIKSFAIDGTNISIRCNETCGPILAAFASEFHKLVEPITGGALDDWGYAYRPIRGTTDSLSNHASGTAIDLNASKHPLGKVNTFTAEQAAKIRKLCKKYNLRWGGDYTNRKDEMHFEITSKPNEVKALVTQLQLKGNK
jgi:hypothetical protein